MNAYEYVCIWVSKDLSDTIDSGKHWCCGERLTVALFLCKLVTCLCEANNICLRWSESRDIVQMANALLSYLVQRNLGQLHAIPSFPGYYAWGWTWWACLQVANYVCKYVIDQLAGPKYDYFVMRICQPVCLTQPSVTSRMASSVICCHGHCVQLYTWWQDTRRQQWCHHCLV